MNMSTQHRSLTRNNIVTHRAVVRDVNTTHQVIIATHTSVAVFFFRPSIDGYAFSNHIPVADNDMGRRSSVADILWLATDHCVGRD